MTPACLFTDKPRLLSVKPGNTTVTEFQDVSLGAVVEGNPAPYVSWVSQSGSVLQNKTGGFNYTITKITRKEMGTYKCIATNSLGSHRREFVISVKGKSCALCKRSLSRLSVCQGARKVLNLFIKGGL